jgi:hypothetical protein
MRALRMMLALCGDGRQRNLGDRRFFPADLIVLYIKIFVLYIKILRTSRTDQQGVKRAIRCSTTGRRAAHARRYFSRHDN